MVSTASNILATLFFALAFVWFIIAVTYACSVVLFLRMRREGRFANISMDDPAFGRYYLCGSRCYIPMGWIFRRFVVQYQNEQERRNNKGRVMDKAERRNAMDILLGGDAVAIAKEKNGNAGKQQDLNTSADTSSSSSSSSESETDEEMGCDFDSSSLELPSSSSSSSSSDVENVCSICLGHYNRDQDVSMHAWTSPVCKHRFHRNCLLAWLEQPGKTECPCCREILVEEDDVWKTVKRLRKQQRRAPEHKKKTKAKKQQQSSNTASSPPSPTTTATALAPMMEDVIAPDDEETPSSDALYDI